SYDALRVVEHCLQMIADEQTHTLPEDEPGLGTIAAMGGYRGIPAFSKTLRQTLETVRRRYDGLFEAAPALGAETGRLVFTGDTDDPETLATLSRLGYAGPASVTQTVRGWHFG